MQQIRINRGAHRPPPALPVLSQMSLRQARAHEFCGTGRRTLALLVANRTTGPVIWVRPAWMQTHLNPDGIHSYIAPGRLVFVNAARKDDILWCTEEALRSGAAALVVAEMVELPPLTPVRRLHLAAEAGAQTGPQPPLGLLLTPGAGGIPGIESRWSLSGEHRLHSCNWRLKRLRARTDPQADWALQRDQFPKPASAWPF